MSQTKKYPMINKFKKRTDLKGIMSGLDWNVDTCVYMFLMPFYIGKWSKSSKVQNTQFYMGIPILSNGLL